MSTSTFVYPYRAFVVHKPVGVVSSTVDNDPPPTAGKETTVKKSRRSQKKSERLKNDGQGDGERTTVYSIAAAAGFPTDVGLVGRLDAQTSGIILFTDDHLLNRGISVPVLSDSDDQSLACSPFKCKEYELRLLSKLGHDPSSSSAETEFDIERLEEELAQPFTFQKDNSTKSCDAPVEVSVLKRYQDLALSRGRDNLGWCVDVRIVLREGRHHQIRRIARRSGYIVKSLHRTRIAGILSVATVPAPGQCRWLEECEIAALYEGLHLDTAVLQPPSWAAQDGCHNGTRTPLQGLRGPGPAQRSAGRPGGGVGGGSERGQQGTEGRDAPSRPCGVGVPHTSTGSGAQIQRSVAIRSPTAIATAGPAQSGSDSAEHRLRLLELSAFICLIGGRAG
jgi:16S rRNA U516 pseudouridylate synthase RsuA-like enzyme